MGLKVSVNKEFLMLICFYCECFIVILPIVDILWFTVHVLYATTLLITKNLIRFGDIKVERMNEAIHFCLGTLVFHLKPLLWV